MKTDRFTDIIRRKLESIRPEFTDNDWARMQSTLNDANLPQPNTPNVHQPFPGGLWSGQPWLLAAASISTVALIALGVWQRREINQLRQTIGQLQTPAIHQPVPTPSIAESKGEPHFDVAQSPKVLGVEPPGITSSANRNESQATRPDTVYITRYVATPSRSNPQTRPKEHLSHQWALSDDQQSATEMPTAPSIARRSANLPDNQPIESHDASSTSPAVVNNTYSESTTASKSAVRSVRQKGLQNRIAGTSAPKRSRKASLNPVGNDDVVNANSVSQSERSVAATQPSANYNLVTHRPLVLPKKNWTISLAQRARRMQPARPTVVTAESAQEPESQPVKSMATRFRVGASGEVASRLWSVGVYTELLVGKHLTVGVGLNEATYLNRFITEDDFNGRTQRDFRKEFGRGINAWGDILNIDTRQVRLQLPINLGYRIPLNQSLALLTSAGTFLNLTSAENVTFYCRPPQFPPMQPQPQSGFTEVEASRSQSVALINSLSLGAGIEWQRGHWALQATPVLTIPTQTDPKVKQIDLNWQQNVTAGLRARLMYQF